MSNEGMRSAPRLRAETEREKQLVAEIASWLRHIDRLDEIQGAKWPRLQFNPLWDASVELERRFS